MRIRDVFRPPFELSLVWLLLPMGLFGVGMAALPMRSWDYWWHIAFGRMIASTHEMPLYAHFLYTMPAEAPSYVQAWLSQWALYLMHESIGMSGVLIVRNLLAAVAYTFLGMWAARRAGSAPLGGLLACAGAVFGFFTIDARSHLLAWPLLLFVVPVAYAVRHKVLRLRWLATLPLLSLAWANLHGTFLVPSLVVLACLGAAIADRILPRPEIAGSVRPEIWPWAATLAATLGASLLNPRGYEIFLYLHDLPTNVENLRTVTEWFPATPFFPPFYGAFFWFLLIGTLVLMWRRRARVDYLDLFLLVGFSLLAMQHSRALMWVGLCFPVVAAPYVRELGRIFAAPPDDAPGRVAQAINVSVAALLILAPIAAQPWGFGDPLSLVAQAAPTRTEEPLRGLVSPDTPVEPAQILRGRPDLRIFHDHQYPGFLIYWLDDEVPDQMVFLDNRVELPPASIWRLYESLSAGEDWRAVFARYDINAVVASTDNQAGLIEALREAPDWNIAFENDYHVLFLPTERP